MQVSEGMRKSRGAATASSAIGNATEMKRGIDMTGTMMSVTTKGMTRGTAIQMKKGLGGTGIGDLIVSSRSSGHHDRDSRDQAHRDRESLHDRHHSRDDRSREQHRSSKSSGQRVGDASMPAKKSNPDFEREIPGYAKMTPAERMKARTKLLLSRSAKQASTLSGTPVYPSILLAAAHQSRLCV